jgi:hypothetical protein
MAPDAVVSQTALTIKWADFQVIRENSHLDFDGRGNQNFCFSLKRSVSRSMLMPAESEDGFLLSQLSEPIVDVASSFWWTRARL